MSIVRIGLLGLGTVGSGVLKTIRLQEKKLTERLGQEVQIVKVLVRDIEKERHVKIDSSLLTTSFAEVLEAQVDIVVEVMGGVNPTFDYVCQAFQQGCHVVTANKELLAKRGKQLIDLANQHKVHFYYEASVAGGIPIINVLRQFLQTNSITSIRGILNGTTNYILSQMEQNGGDYAEVLKEAQRLGYAEADPTSDVEGYDALYKLFILAQLVFGEAPELDLIEREGITNISVHELHMAKQLAYKMKLMATAAKVDGQLRLAVKPLLLPVEHPLAAVTDAYNGIQIKGNIVGDLLFTGKGAGEFPTASAVIEDVAFIVTQSFRPQQGWVSKQEGPKEMPSSFSLVEGKQFVYLESNKQDGSLLYHILEQMEKEKVNVIKVLTDDDDVTRVGLIVQGISSKCLDLIQKQYELKVKYYPILGEEHEQEDDGILAQEKQVINH